MTHQQAFKKRRSPIPTLLSNTRSKTGLTRRLWFLVRVESLVCTLDIIGLSRSAGNGGMRSRASDAICLDALFGASANALLRYRSRGPSQFRNAGARGW